MDLNQHPSSRDRKCDKQQPSTLYSFVFTYVSKSISYKVSENGTLTGLHIFEEAASAGCVGTPSIPVADAKAVAATVDPV